MQGAKKGEISEASFKSALNLMKKMTVYFCKLNVI